MSTLKEGAVFLKSEKKMHFFWTILQSRIKKGAVFGNSQFKSHKNLIQDFFIIYKICQHSKTKPYSKKTCVFSKKVRVPLTELGPRYRNLEFFSKKFRVPGTEPSTRYRKLVFFRKKVRVPGTELGPRCRKLVFFSNLYLIFGSKME